MSRDFLQHRSVRCTFVLNTAVLFLSRSIFILQKVGQKPRSTPWLFMKCMSNCRRRSEQYLRLGPTRNYILLSVTIAFLLFCNFVKLLIFKNWTKFIQKPPKNYILSNSLIFESPCFFNTFWFGINLYAECQLAIQIICGIK